jgi:nucleoside-diphosphate-sugar epimerase
MMVTPLDLDSAYIIPHLEYLGTVKIIDKVVFMDRVLLTGISGFLGGHVALALLQKGFAVRGSLRDVSAGDKVRAAFVAAGADVSALEFCRLDLLDDRGWTEAAADCRFLQHVASPFVLTMPKDENELIRPAVEGARRAVRAALDAGHERIVMTSSLAAIDGGHANYDRALTIDDWTVVDGPLVTAYSKSKTLAEREAWSLVAKAAARDRLAIINPGTMLGPLLDDDPGTSAAVVQRLLKGEMPMIPDLILPYVDVRDVADAHVAAMTDPAAGGHRHIVTNQAEPLHDIAETLRREVPAYAGKVPTRQLPSWLAGLLAVFDKSLRDSRTYLGIRRSYDGRSGETLLGRPLASTKNALLATAHSLIERKLV